MGRGGASRHRNPAIIARARRPTANSAVSKTRRPRPVAGKRIFRTRKPRPEAGTSLFKRQTPRPVVGTRAFRTRTSRPGSRTRDLKLGKPRPDTRTRPVKMWVGLPARRFGRHPCPSRRRHDAANHNVVASFSPGLSAPRTTLGKSPIKSSEACGGSVRASV